MKNIVKWFLETFNPKDNELYSRSKNKEKARAEFDAKCKERYFNNWKIK